MEKSTRKRRRYSELSEAELAMLKRVTELGWSLASVVAEMRGNEAFNQEWVEIAAPDLRRGAGALARAIVEPD